MTVIRPNSITGITSITAQANEINVFRHNGVLAGLQLNGVNHHTSAGVSTFHTVNVLGNLDVAGVLTYQDVTNVDSLGIGTFRTGINVSGGTATFSGQITANDTINLASAKKLSMAGDVFKIYHSTNAAIINESVDLLINQNVSNKDIKISTGSGPTERVIIKSNGYVGIGTNNPQRPFVISNSGAAGVEFNIPDGNGGLSLNLYNRVTTGYDPLTFNAGYFVFGVNAIEKARFDSSGRLLIGTTTEGHPAGDNLTIADSGHAGITIRSGTTSNGALYFSDGTSGSDEYRGGVVYHHDGNYMRFYTNGTERIRIDSSGTFHVKTNGMNLENATATNSRAYAITNAAGTTGWTFGNGVTASSHQYVIYDNTAGAARFQINGNGAFGLNGGSYGAARQVMVSNGSGSAVSWSSNPFLLDMDSLGDLDYDGVFLRYREVNVSGNGLVYLGLCKSTTNCPAGRIGCPVGYVPGVVYNSQFRVDKVGITPWPDGSGHRYEYFAIISDYVSAGKLGIFYLTNSTN